MSEFSDLRASLESLASLSARSNLLRVASPFGALDAEQARQLISRMREVVVPAGHDIIRQGEPGQACFMIEGGTAVVVLNRAGEEIQVDQVGPGEIVGEASLLSAQPRNATVRAVDDCRVLEIQRADLLDVIAGQGGDDRLVKLMRMRERPLRREGVTAHHRTLNDGAQITVLKDRERRAYYRLSEQGFFVWSRLDGSHNLRDLTLEYHRQHGVFAPFAIAETVAGLAQAGFATRTPVTVNPADQGARGWQRLARRAKRILEYQAGITGVDRFWSALYQRIGRHLFTMPGKVLMAAVTIVGLFPS